MVLKKRLNFFYFQWKKVDQVRSEYLRSYLNWLYNWQLKSRRRSHALKGSHSMGDGRIFLKTGHDASFNKDLSKNEPHFDRIHLAGQFKINIFPGKKLDWASFKIARKNFCFSSPGWYKGDRSNHSNIVPLSHVPNFCLTLAT
jgi:hypothetical protein